MKYETFCEAHPKYMGKGRPTVQCRDCWAFYQMIVELRLAENQLFIVSADEVK